MLTDGFNHVAVITKDADRLLEFYGEVFGATKAADDDRRAARTSPSTSCG